MVGADCSLADGIIAARLCAINLIAQFKAAADGDLDRVARVLRLGGYVQAGPEFYEIPTVMRSEEHTSELQSLMRISYAVFCLTKNIKNEHGVANLDLNRTRGTSDRW